jgi:hypothetical protein
VRNYRSDEEVEWRGLRSVREKIDDDAERKPHVGKGEPGEDKGEDIILQGRALVSIILDGNEGSRTKAWMWKKNIRMIPWPDRYMLKK